MMEKIASIIFVIVLVVFFVLGLVGCSYDTVVQRRCIKAGYPEYSTTITLEGYCISWIDATKVVVPLGEINDLVYRP